MFKYLYCKITSHKLVYAGECPFTGGRYDYCERCEAMIPLDIID